MNQAEVEARSSSRKALSAALLIAVIVAGVLGVLYLQAYDSNSKLNSQLGKLQSQIAQLSPSSGGSQTQGNAVNISSIQQSVVGLQNEISNDNATIANLQNQISGYKANITALNAQIATLKSTIASDTSTISTLQNQLTAAQNTISEDTAKINQDEATINQLQSTIASLQSQLQSTQSQLQSVQSLLGLQVTTQEYSNTLQGPEGQNNFVVQFTASYAGYVVISGTSSNSGMQLQVDDSSSFYSWNGNNQGFGYSNTLDFPVLPGLVQIYVYAPCGLLGCTLQGGSYSTTLTVTYVS